MKLLDKVKELKDKYLNTNKKQDNTIYCRICGKKINKYATYCPYCGEEVKTTTTSFKENNNKLFYEKCPRCGEINSFDQIYCKACGCELRGKKASSFMETFSRKFMIMKDPQQKINYIKSTQFPITREDILELMNFAVSNFNAERYVEYKDYETIDSALLAKIEQCHNARDLLDDQKDKAYIDKLYKDTQNKIKSLSKKNNSKKTLKIILIIISLIIMFGGMFITVESEIETYRNIGSLSFLFGLTLMIIFIVQLKKDKKEKR